MGTTWSVKINNPHMLPLPTIRLAIENTLAHIIQQMSPWQADSEISIFNRARPATWHTLSSEFMTVLTCALRWAHRSQGAFNPCVGALVNAWGFGPRTEPHPPPQQRLPTSAQIENIKNSTHFEDLKIKPETQQIWQAGNIQLDFSGIAKGFAVDQVCASLQTLGIEGALVEIGGDLRAYGLRPDRQPWRATIQPQLHLNNAKQQTTTTTTFSVPQKTTTNAPQKIALTNLAIATSGDAWHVFEYQNRRYSHTIDPRTGAPIAHALASVSVAHASCMEADALATLLLVLGPDAGWSFASQYGLAALFVTHADKPTPAAASLHTPAATDNTYPMSPPRMTAEFAALQGVI